MIYAFIVFLLFSLILLIPTAISVGQRIIKWASKSVRPSHFWTKKPDKDNSFVIGGLLGVVLTLFLTPLCTFFNYNVSPLISRTADGGFAAIHGSIGAELDHLSFFTGLLAYVCLSLLFYKLRVKLHQGWKKRQLAGENEIKSHKIPKAKIIK